MAYQLAGTLTDKKWESNIAMERLEKVLQWNSVIVEGKAIHQNKFLLFCRDTFRKSSTSRFMLLW